MNESYLSTSSVTWRYEGQFSVYSSLYSQISRGHLWMMKWLLIMSSSCRCLFPGLYIDMLLHVNICKFSSVQSLSYVQLFVTPWIAAHQASLSITKTWSSLKLMSIESVMPSSHLILCHPLLLLLPVPPSLRVFSSEPTRCTRWPKYGVSALASVLWKLGNTKDVQTTAQ